MKKKQRRVSAGEWGKAVQAKKHKNEIDKYFMN